MNDKDKDKDKDKELKALWDNIAKASINESELRKPLSQEEEENLTLINESNLHSAIFNSSKDIKKSKKVRSYSKIVNFLKTRNFMISYPSASFVIAATLVIGIFIGSQNNFTANQSLYSENQKIDNIDKNNKIVFLGSNSDNFITNTDDINLTSVIEEMKPGMKKSFIIDNDIALNFTLSRQPIQNANGDCYKFTISINKEKIKKDTILSACKTMTDIGYIWALEDILN